MGAAAGGLADQKTPSSYPTTPPAGPRRRALRARMARRAFLFAVAVLVGAAALGLLGVRTTERSARSGGYELTVTYATVARGGLAAPWSLDIVKEGGFDEGETVRVRLDASYFDLYDENGFDPDPSASTASGRYLYQEYEAPRGDTLTLSFDARIEPAAQSGRSGTAAVLDEDGSVLVEVSFRTRVLP